jgi:MAC/Perforin domain
MKATRMTSLALGLLLLIACAPDKPPYDEQAIAGIKEYLGKGYKGYEYYADPRSITTPIFDVSGLKGIEVQESPSYDGRFVYGQSKKDYFEELSASIALAGSYAGFSGEVIGNFSKQALINTNNVFATSNVTQAYYRLSLTDEAVLMPRAIEDLANLQPVALFDKYGTHYLKSIYIGARVSFNSSADITRVSKNFDMNATVKAAYAEVVKGESSGGSVAREDLQEVSNNRHIRVMGGDPAKANAIVEGTGEPSKNYNDWSKSVPDYVSIADFDKGGLVPIYLLAATAERRAELEAAWKTYMEQHTDDILEEEDPKPVPVYKNSRIKLLSSDDRYISTAESATRYYYARLGQDGVVLQLGGTNKPLISGSIVSIKTTEKFKKSWQDYNLLGAFGDATELYYWKDYGSKTNWIIEKTDPNQQGAPIYYGEWVYVKNEAFTNQYLTPYVNNYLTTKENEKHKWRIEKE